MYVHLCLSIRYNGALRVALADSLAPDLDAVLLAAPLMVIPWTPIIRWLVRVVPLARLLMTMGVSMRRTRAEGVCAGCTVRSREAGASLVSC